MWEHEPDGHPGEIFSAKIDIFLRCLPHDRAFADRLAAALSAFGYTCEIGVHMDPPHFAGLQAHRTFTRATLALWSRASVADDGYIHELAKVADLDSVGGKTLLYFAQVEPLQCTMVIGGLGNPKFRLWNDDYADLSAWSGDPAAAALAPLLFELPRPMAPAANPPQPRPTSMEEVRALERAQSGGAEESTKPWPQCNREALEAGAAAGDLEAIVALADRIIRTDEHARGLSLLKRAEAAGSHQAVWLLGVFEPDRNQRLGWLERGASLGMVNCLEALIDVRLVGLMSGADLKRVRAFYDQRPHAPREDWTTLALARELWQRDKSPEGRRRALDLLFAAHVEHGSSEADIFLGDAFRNGAGGLKPDRKEAIACYQQSFRAENAPVHRIAIERLRRMGVKPEASESTIEEAMEQRVPFGYWELRR